jgi:hypothetical protein
MLEPGVVSSDVPEDIRRAIKTRAAELVEEEKGEASSFGRKAWNSMKAKAKAMTGWRVEKGMECMWK